MKQRHIPDEYSSQDISINNNEINDKKRFVSKEQYYPNPESLDANTDRCVNNINTETYDLIGNLEEFGLSQYESRAYLTMIGKGSLSASEIAYYSHLPRTKIYLTLKKLEKKGLTIISQQKPLICSAINPTDAFEEIVILQEQKLENMKRVVEKLQQINEESNSLKGLEEKRYFILDAKSTLQKLSNLVENTRTSIIAIIDIWGLRLLSESRSSLIKAITKGVKIQFLISNHCIGSEYLSFLPNEIMIKIGNVTSNIIILDSSNIINIDGANGKAALFTSIDVLGFSYMKIFEDEWRKATEIKNLNKTESLNQLKAVQIIKFIEDLSCFSTSKYLYSAYLSNLSSLQVYNNNNDNNNNVKDEDLDYSSSTYIDSNIHPVSYPDRKGTKIQNMPLHDKNHKSDENNSKSDFNKNYVSFLNYLSKYGINVHDYSIEDLFQIINLALRMNYSGEIRYDKDSNILSIYSKDNVKSLVIMTILLSSYFLNLKYEIDLTPNISKIMIENNEIETDTFQIKFSKQLINKNQ